MGHYLRRYYSYITDREISMVTGEDKIIDTNPEGGVNAERIIFGRECKYLYLREALSLLYPGEFEQFPLFEKIIIDKNKLQNIIRNNKELFDFIDTEKDEEQNLINESNEEEEDNESDEEKEDNESNKDEDSKEKIIDNENNGKITLSQYYSFIKCVKRPYPSIVTCGINSSEIYILF